MGRLAPILILHVLLLPLNTLRLMQLRNLSSQIERAARETFSPRALLSLMRHREIKVNETLFSAGDQANELFYVVEGTIFLPELQRGSGRALLGEFALFSESGRRTATAIARTDCKLMSLSRGAVFTALVQEPQLGIHLLKLITTRFLQNAGQDQKTPPVIALEPAISAAKAVLSRFSGPGARTAIRIAVLASVALVVWLAYHPVYTMLDRDAAVTSWLNVVTAPIAGTVEGLDHRRGRAGRQVRGSRADRESQRRPRQRDRAEGRTGRRKSGWRKRPSTAKAGVATCNGVGGTPGPYADGFRRDLDLEIQDSRTASPCCKEKGWRFPRRLAKRGGHCERPGPDHRPTRNCAVDPSRDQVSLTQMSKALEARVERRDWPGKAYTCKRMARNRNGRGAAWTSSGSRCNGPSARGARDHGGGRYA